MFIFSEIPPSPPNHFPLKTPLPTPSSFITKEKKGGGDGTRFLVLFDIPNGSSFLILFFSLFPVLLSSVFETLSCVLYACLCVFHGFIDSCG